ncbi:putative carboxypeptidase [Microtetraspora sp. NBRC 13810]|uniref:S66 peptidase family protein n=1 Tax=Microtetraspora sp. NBRC 13810 TaxID=3030990 RepID=UPI0024A2E017|nr:LD-carboxypeptidase [Microtetraspora sp. NBRC 13810]GLW08298.1 putative carboxypeptidase [Microtetraspora sp. NBRC 13810]
MSGEPTMDEGLRTPRSLKPGDRVAVVAPSGPVEPDTLERGVAVLTGMGLEVSLGAHVMRREGYLAGFDAERAADLAGAWCDPSVAAVVCARGGYGASRLLGLLDWDAMAAAEPKILLGSSDITALHQAFALRLGVASCFGPMPGNDVLGGAGGPEPRSLASLRAALTAGPEPVTGDRVLVPGRARAPLTGGNLSLLAALCGTPYAPRFAGRIAFLEDVGEQPYRIDRMLTQLLQAGAFDGVAGVALGSWVDCGDPMPVLADRLVPLGVPVLAGLPVGHGSPQQSVWLGGLGVIDTESCSLTGLLGDREKTM